MLESIRKFFVDWKEAIAGVSSFVTIIAIGISARWSYMLFVKRRLGHPRADMTQTITHRKICDGKILIRVTATIENKGEVLILIENGFTRFLQVHPCGDDLLAKVQSGKFDRTPGGSRINWPMLEKVRYIPKEPREIEPGETDEIHFDAVVNEDVQIVVAHTCLENVKKRDKAFVWEKSTMYDLAFPPKGNEMPSSDEPNESTIKIDGLRAVVPKQLARVVLDGNGARPKNEDFQAKVDSDPPPVSPPKQK